MNPNVLCQESSVAAAVGTSLVGSTYKVYGLSIPQSNFEDIINQSADDEQNLLGLGVYQSSDSVIGPAVINFQVADSAYNIIMSLPGYAAAYFSSGVGDTRFDPSAFFVFMNGQADRYKDRRDRAFRSLQNILESGTGPGMIDTNQPGYSQPAAPVY